MKVLILGAAGFIGNACYDYFSKENKVSGIDLSDRYSKGLIVDPDLTATKKMIADNQFDAVINCAGSANIKESFVSPENDFLANTAYVENILKLLKEYSPQTKFINISSAAVYGNPEGLPIKENARTKPLSPYGKNKLKSEEVLREYFSEFKIPTLSVRIFSAYGVGLKQQFFYDLYNKFRSNENEVKLFGTGNESRDFIFISDIVEALGTLIVKGMFNGEAYNLAHGEESYIKDAAKTFAEILNYKGQLVFTNEQLEGYPLNWCADITRLKDLGFAPKIKLEQGLEHYANWLKNNTA